MHLISALSAMIIMVLVISALAAVLDAAGRDGVVSTLVTLLGGVWLFFGVTALRWAGDGIQALRAGNAIYFVWVGIFLLLYAITRTLDGTRSRERHGEREIQSLQQRLAEVEGQLGEIEERRTINDEERKEARHLFHALWGRDVGPNYRKADWSRLGTLLERADVHVW